MKSNAKAFPFALALAARTSGRSFPRFPLLRTNRVSLSVLRPSEHFFLRQTNSRTAVSRRTPSGRSFPIHGVCTIWKGTSWNGVRIGSAPCLAEFRPIRQARLPVRAAGKSCAVNSQMWSRKPGQVSLASRKFVQFASLLGDLCVLCVLLRLKTLRVVHYYLAGVRKRNPRIQSGPEVPLPDRHNLRK